MANSLHYSAVVSIPTLVGSILSFLASGATLIAHVVFPPKWHFRHALILNLFIADCLNSLNNTASGIVVLVNRHRPGSPLDPGPACNANAWIGQFTVQAIDFNILIMSVVVLLIVRQNRIMVEPSKWTVCLLCAAAWLPSTITSNIGLGLHAYGPVSGNWCWIKNDLLDLRYALTHGWRIAIFFITTIIYIYIYIYLKVKVKRFTNLMAPMNSAAYEVNEADEERGLEADTYNSIDTGRILVTSTYATTSLSAENLTFHDDEGSLLSSDGSSLAPSKPSSYITARGNTTVVSSPTVSTYDQARSTRTTLSSPQPNPTVVTSPTMANRKEPHASTAASVFSKQSSSTVVASPVISTYKQAHFSRAASTLSTQPTIVASPMISSYRQALPSKSASTMTSTRPALTALTTVSTAGSRHPHPPPQPLQMARLRRMLLLNGYPLLYIILWIPGIANRLAGSLGHAPLWLTALQASTQFIGLFNALTYGRNEKLKDRIKRRKGKWSIWRRTQ